LKKSFADQSSQSAAKSGSGTAQIETFVYCASSQIDIADSQSRLCQRTKMATLEDVSIDDELDREIQSLSTDDIVTRTRLLENEIKVRCLCGVAES
jgi:hypothetical protein